MTPKNKVVVAELKRIAAKSGGILKPSAVVEAARPAKSPLHSSFEWDDTKAAERHRLWQARQLISVCVQIIPTKEDENNEERVWVSLKEDRKDEGYRPLVSVLSDAELRKLFLAEALAEAEYFQEKYQHIEELSEVFRAIKKVRLQHAPSAEIRA